MRRFEINQTILRIIALITMLIDHIGAFMWLVFPTGTKEYQIAYVFRCIGRIALPLFLFMTAEGMRKTHNKWKYLLRIFIIWLPIVLVEAGAAIYMGSAHMLPAQAVTEILIYVLLMCFLTEKGWKKIFAIFPVLFVIFSFVVDQTDPFGVTFIIDFPSFLLCDYDIYGLLLFLGFVAVYPLHNWLCSKFAPQNGQTLEEFKDSFAGRKMFNNLSIIVLVLLNVVAWLLVTYASTGRFWLYLDQYHIQTYSVLAGIPIYFYNGKRGWNNKWFNLTSYLFYPVHMLILVIVFGLLFWL